MDNNKKNEEPTVKELIIESLLKLSCDNKLSGWDRCALKAISSFLNKIDDLSLLDTLYEEMSIELRVMKCINKNTEREI